MRFPDFNDDWTQTTLGEIAEINPVATESIPQRFQYIDLESVEQGRIVKNNILTKDEAPSRAQRVLSNGDVIFQMVRPYQQNNLYFNLNSNIPVVASTGYAQLRGFQSSHFLYYAVHTPIFLGEVLNRCTGSNYPAINSTDLSAITLALPSPAEQKRIADFLSLIDERIQSCSETIKELKTQKAGLLNQLFSQKLRFPDFTDEWTQTTLGEIADVYQPTTISSSDLNGFGDYYVYGANGIIGRYHSYNHQKKQICIACRGSSCGTVNLTKEYVWITGNSMVVNLDNHSYSTKLFVYYYLNTLNYAPYISGSGQPQIIRSSIVNITLRIPSLAEQKKIADFLSLIDERIEVEEQLLQQYEKQKRYLLKQMFV